jgi:hypothetical protein
VIVNNYGPQIHIYGDASRQEAAAAIMRHYGGED